MAEKEDGMSDFVARMTEEVNSMPLSEEFFMELFGISTNAMTGKLRTIPPDDERCLEDAPPGTLILTDVPENQMAFAIFDRCREKFGNDGGERVAQSFLHRWFAIMKAKHDGLFDEFVKASDQDGMILIHDGVFRAAAALNVGPDGYFNKTEYIGKIRDIIRAEEEGRH
jgi:hypothetical protein